MTIKEFMESHPKQRKMPQLSHDAGLWICRVLAVILTAPLPFLVYHIITMN